MLTGNAKCIIFCGYYYDRRRIFKQSMVRRNMKFSCMDIMYQEISLTLFIVDVVIMDLQRLLLFHI